MELCMNLRFTADKYLIQYLIQYLIHRKNS